MIRIFFIMFTVLLFSAAPIFASPDDYTVNCDLLLGAKYLDESDWTPVHSQALSGINLDLRPFHWPVSIAAAYLYSYNKDEDAYFNPAWSFNYYDTTGTTAEARIGIRKTWERSTEINSYIAGGACFIHAQQKLEHFSGFVTSDHDTAPGLWLALGARWTIIQHLNLGIEASFSRAQGRLWHTDNKSGGFNLGLFSGFHW